MPKNTNVKKVMVIGFLLLYVIFCAFILLMTEMEE